MRTRSKQGDVFKTLQCQSQIEWSRRIYTTTVCTIVVRRNARVSRLLPHTDRTHSNTRGMTTFEVIGTICMGISLIYLLLRRLPLTLSPVTLVVKFGTSLA